jgi:rubrerythrin
MNIFEKALDFELKGNKMYLNFAQDTDNPLLSEIYRYIAQQEQEHFNKIKEYAKKKGMNTINHNTTTNHNTIRHNTIKHNKTESERFFKTTIQKYKNRLEMTDNDLDARKDAMDFEKMSYDYYKELFDKADEKDKDFLMFMMDQENLHYQIIQKSFEYLDDPANFNADDEDWHFEG